MLPFKSVTNLTCCIVKEDDGPFYTHLGAAGSEKELREVLEDRFVQTAHMHDLRICIFHAIFKIILSFTVMP